MAFERFLAHRLAVTGVVVLGALAALALLAPLVSPYDAEKTDLLSIYESPSTVHPMGTDSLGRDLATRILYGGRVSLTIGLLTAAVAISLGTLVGGLAGFHGRWVDGVLMRFVDMMYAFPRLFLLILFGVMFKGMTVGLIVVVLGALVALWTWRAAGDLRRGIVVGGCILGGAVLAIAPWSAYASDRAGEFVPVTRGSASALFVGTYLPGNGSTVGMKRSLGAAAKRRNPKLRGTADFDLEARSVLAVVADRHPGLDFNQAISLEARHNISRYVRDDPVGYAGMMLNKVQRMWSRYARGGARHTSPLIRGWHILLVLLAVAGLVAGIARRRSLLLACILAAALVSTAVHMLVVSQARYNLPLMPALLAGGVAGWAMFLRGHGRRRAETAADAAAVRSSSSRTEKLASAA